MDEKDIQDFNLRDELFDIIDANQFLLAGPPQMQLTDCVMYCRFC